MQVHACGQVTDSTIEMTEKQHSTGSAPPGMDDLAEQHRRAFEAGAAAHREAQEVRMRLVHACLLQRS